MTLGLIAGPLQMLFSLLLMQGLSLTMFRTFLNQAIPRFDPMRFSMSVGNAPALTSSTPAPAAVQMDAQNLLPYLNLLAPVILQHMNRQQNGIQPIASSAQPSNQPQMLSVSGQVMTQPMQPVQPTYQMPVYQAPAFQVPAQNGQPQVIIVPQLMPSQSSSKSSASTHFPIQVEPPHHSVTKRMLERPPKTTRRPKVENRAHAGALYIQFVTPKAPAGFRRYIIPAVTANIGADFEVTTQSSYSTQSPNIYDQISNEFGNHYLTTKSSNDVIDERSDSEGVNEDNHSSGEEITETTTPSVNEDSVSSVDETDMTTTSSSVTTPSSVTTNSSSDNQTITSEPKITEVSTNETIDDKNLLNHRLNETKDNKKSINNLIHKDFDEYVRNISLNQIESNQSQDIYFDNSKDLDQDQDVGTHAFKRVCYYLLRAKDGNLKIKDIDPHICSHLIVGYASVSPNDLLVPRNPSEDPEKYRELTNLKSINRKLKVMLSIGDGSGASFSKMVSNEKSRDRFVASVLDVCDAFDFDGVDIDWEYPYFRTGSKEDKRNFVLLLKEIRREAIRRFRNDFIISASVGAPLVIATSAYDIPMIGDAVDFVNLMSYDFNMYRWDRPYTGHHSPLYPRPTEKQYFQTLNAAWSATYWANKGMPSHKIVVGVPTYARTYSLVVPVSQGLDVPVSGPGLGGGKLNYTGVCHFLSSGATREFDVYSQVPFAYKNFDWVAYESEVSAALKAQWVVKANMGGIMTFALNFDDIKGDCRRDGKRFPIQKAISNLLELSSIKAYRESEHSPALAKFITRKITR